jgi:hypothetical protein
MKINGVQVDNQEAIFGPFVIVRGDKKFGIYASPVWSFDEFDELCPIPDPPMTGWNAKTGKKEADPRSAAYKEMIANYGRKKWGYLVLKSLEPSKLDLTEYGISLADPESWLKVEEALTGPAGLSFYEYEQVMKLVDEANSLDSEKLEVNRESFLLEVAQAATSSKSSHNGEPSSSQSGQLVNGGE